MEFSELDDLVKTIARKVLHEQPTRIEPIVGLGWVNAVFRVETRAGQFVIRINTDEGIGRFQKEVWCIEQATALGIPSPTVVACDEFPGAIYMVQAFIPGENGMYYAGDKRILWQRMGEYARLFHSVPVVGFSEDLVDATQNRFHDTWERFVTYNINKLNEQDALRRLHVLTPVQSDKLYDIFEKLLATPFKFGLIHGDLSEKNVLVQPGGDIYLLDWGSAEAHIVPHFELFMLHEGGLVAGSPEEQAFLRGYGLTDYQPIQPELDALTLLTYVDKLRWALDRKPDMIDEFAQRARQAVERLISL